MFEVSGKVALVTGGASGIGLAYVDNLLSNECKGVGIVDILENDGGQVVQDLIVKHGQGRVIFIKANITDKRELEGAFEKTIKIYNQLDIVINNAGTVDEEDFENTIALNLTAVVRGCRLAMKTYLPKYKTGEGIIVNTASIAGLTYMPLPIYSCSKHAVVALGKCLSYECKESNIRILTICPGATATKIQKKTKNTDVSKNLNKVASFSDVQNADDVGKALISVINNGTNGSVWVCDGKPVYEVTIIPQHQLKHSKQ